MWIAWSWGEDEVYGSDRGGYESEQEGKGDRCHEASVCGQLGRDRELRQGRIKV